MADVPLKPMSQVPPNQEPQIPQVPQNQMPPVAQVAFSPKPCTVTCPSCGASIVTTVTMQPSSQAQLLALILSCCGLLCACVPYCMDSCRNADHYCPNCGTYLGTYKR